MTIKRPHLALPVGAGLVLLTAADVPLEVFIGSGACLALMVAAVLLMAGAKRAAGEVARIGGGILLLSALWPCLRAAVLFHMETTAPGHESALSGPVTSMLTGLAALGLVLAAVLVAARLISAAESTRRPAPVPRARRQVGTRTPRRLTPRETVERRSSEGNPDEAGFLR